MKVFLSLILFLFSCSPYLVNEHAKLAEYKNLRQCSAPVFYALSAILPYDKEDEIKGAFEYWNNKVGQEIFIDSGILIFPGEKFGSGILTVELGNTGKNYASTQYNYNEQGCFFNTHIFLSAKLAFESKDDIFTTVLRHEVGHALGLAHVFSLLGDDLMCAQVFPDMDHPLDASEEEIENVKILYNVR